MKSQKLKIRIKNTAKTTVKIKLNRFGKSQSGYFLCFFLAQARLTRFFIASGCNKVFYIFHRFALALVIELIERGEEGGLLRGKVGFTACGNIG